MSHFKQAQVFAYKLYLTGEWKEQQPQCPPSNPNKVYEQAKTKNSYPLKKLENMFTHLENAGTIAEKASG